MKKTRKVIAKDVMGQAIEEKLHAESAIELFRHLAAKKQDDPAEWHCQSKLA